MNRFISNCLHITCQRHTANRLLRKQYAYATTNDLLSNAKRFSVSYHDDEEDGIPNVRGVELLRDPRLNKGTNFSLVERQALGIHGLLPPVVFSEDEQVERLMANVRIRQDNLSKWRFLTSLQDRNEKLFYKLLIRYIEELAPIVYTPTVGRACQTYGFNFRRSTGFYVTINDRGHIYDILCNWPDRKVKAVVVTDGERILGLGDLGAYGMGIAVGKLSLYSAIGGIRPRNCLPITIDVGTDNDALLEDKMYIGLRHKRVRGRIYDELVDELMEAIARRFGKRTLVQFEDFANRNAYRLLNRYKNKYLMFNDDIQGTAAAVLGGLFAACRATNQDLKNNKYLFLGAGGASTGIAELLQSAMEEDGLSPEEAADRIWMVDVDGLLTKDRSKGSMNKHNVKYAKDHAEMTDLEEICRSIQPSVAIGAAAAPGAFTKQFLEDMASFNEHPIVFALSNPTSMAECTAEEAYKYTEGRCIFASGSPFGPVTIEGQTFYPGQGNNSYVFPGIAMASVISQGHYITPGLFLTAAKALAAEVTDEHLNQGRMYPPISDIREASIKVATACVKYYYENKLCSNYPEPEDKEEFVRGLMYNAEYKEYLPKIYGWPGMSHQT